MAALFGPISEKDTIGSPRRLARIENRHEYREQSAGDHGLLGRRSDRRGARGRGARELLEKPPYGGDICLRRQDVDPRRARFEAPRRGHRSSQSDGIRGQGGATQTSLGAPAPRRSALVRVTAPKGGPDALVTEQLSTLKQKLAESKNKLNGLEAEWQRRVLDAQAKLDDLKLRLTPSHPEVVTQQQRVSMVSQVPSEVAALRAEIATLSSDVKAGDLVVSRGSAATGAIAAANADTLPTEVIQAARERRRRPGAEGPALRRDRQIRGSAQRDPVGANRPRHGAGGLQSPISDRRSRGGSFEAEQTEARADPRRRLDLLVAAGARASDFGRAAQRCDRRHLANGHASTSRAGGASAASAL